MKELNTDYSGNNSIGFEGNCIWCKNTERAYYYYADSRRKAAMLAGTFMTLPANCPPCITQRGLPSSMRWKRKLKPKEAIADLTVFEKGGGIDFKAAAQMAKDDAKMDAAMEDDQSKAAEFKEWLDKKN